MTRATAFTPVRLNEEDENPASNESGSANAAAPTAVLGSPNSVAIPIQHGNDVVAEAGSLLDVPNTRRGKLNSNGDQFQIEYDDDSSDDGGGGKGNRHSPEDELDGYQKYLRQLSLTFKTAKEYPNDDEVVVEEEHPYENQPHPWGLGNFRSRGADLCGRRGCRTLLITGLVAIVILGVSLELYGWNRVKHTAAAGGGGNEEGSPSPAITPSTSANDAGGGGGSGGVDGVVDVEASETRESVMMLLERASSAEDLRNADSPQRRALKWMMNDAIFHAFTAEGTASSTTTAAEQLQRAADMQFLLERYALVTLYYSTGGPLAEMHGAAGKGGEVMGGQGRAGEGWIVSKYWLSEEHVCDWVGVRCDEDLRVKELRLVSNNLRGTIPPEVAVLDRLKKLDLSHNLISGALTSAIGELPNLTDLRLSNNHLSGNIDRDVIGKFAKLEVLLIDSNKFGGPIPSSIDRLKSLLILRASGNVLTGALPTTIGMLDRLFEVDLSNNLLAGTIPRELGVLSELQDLSLSSNAFHGSIPSTLTLLTELGELRMDDNALTGELTGWVDKLVSLKVLDLAQNKFSGSLPDEISDLKELAVLSLAENKFTGTVPDSFCGMRLRMFSTDCELSCSCCTVECISPGSSGAWPNDGAPPMPVDSVLSDETSGKSASSKDTESDDASAITEVSKDIVSTAVSEHSKDAKPGDTSAVSESSKDTVPDDTPAVNEAPVDTKSDDIPAVTEVSKDTKPDDPSAVKNVVSQDATSVASPSGEPAPLDLLTEITSIDTLRDTESPQHRAMMWLEDDVFYQLYAQGDIDRDPKMARLEKRGLLERYAMATLYFATGGDGVDGISDGWKEKGDWLSSHQVCEWYGVRCNGRIVTSVELDSNNLWGELPNEIFVVLEKIEVINFGSNHITGDLPDLVVALKDLKYLELQDNDMKGAIPASVCFLDLTVLAADCMGQRPKITCDCCTECFYERNRDDEVSLDAVPPADADPDDTSAVNEVSLDTIPSLDTEPDDPSAVKEVPKDGDSVPSHSGDHIPLELLGEITSIDTLQDTESPQHKAMVWLEGDVFYQGYVGGGDAAMDPGMGNVEKRGLLERYAMATFYFATGGDGVDGISDGWKETENWLSGGQICDWYGIQCSSREITALELDHNNLWGEIPKEIFLVLENVEVIMLGSNHIGGDLPDLVAALKKLEYLELQDNDMAGTMPASVCSLELSKLAADCMGQKPQIKCDCCTDCFYERERDDEVSLDAIPPADAEPDDASVVNEVSLDTIPSLDTEPDDPSAVKEVPKNGDSVPSHSGDHIPLELLGEITSIDTLRDTESPQHKAMDWLKDDVFYQVYDGGGDAAMDPGMGNVEKRGLLERYAMATFYFATGGDGVDGISDGWKQKENWLSGDQICDWYGIQCSGREITALELDHNNLWGEIPNEFFLVLENIEVIMLGSNHISGDLSNLVVALKKLEFLELQDNDMTGAMPTAVCSLELSKLAADCMGQEPQIKCDCCTDCFYERTGG